MSRFCQRATINTVTQKRTKNKKEKEKKREKPPQRDQEFSPGDAHFERHNSVASSGPLRRLLLSAACSKFLAARPAFPEVEEEGGGLFDR